MKKMICLTLTIAMAMSLAACGSSASSESVGSAGYSSVHLLQPLCVYRFLQRKRHLYRRWYETNMAKDNGIAVLGEQAGGGACSPQRTPEPDYLLGKGEKGEYDYSLFFDFGGLSRMIDEYYK